MTQLTLPDCDHSPHGIDGVCWNIMGQVYTPKRYAQDEFVWHATFPEETFVPPHTHVDQDEYLSPLDGEIDIVVDGVVSTLRAGEIGHLPRNRPHAFYNNSGRVVQALFWANPCGELPALYRKIHNISNPRRVTEIAPEYGIHFFSTGFFSEVKPMVIPGTSAPALKVQTVRHGTFDLTADKPEHFSLVVFYRGLHCPICLKYLRELGALLPEFAKRGVQVVVLSTDDAQRAAEMDRKIGVADLRHGFGLTPANARQWGLYLSQGIGKTSIGVEEPALFAEPGVFLVRADHTLYYASVQTMPFARPSFADLLASVDFVLAKNYPARGGYVGEVG